MANKDVLEGLTILLKYCDPNKFDIVAEHDQIYSGPGNDTISESDKARLAALDWVEEEEGWWTKFV